MEKYKETAVIDNIDSFNERTITGKFIDVKIMEIDYQLEIVRVIQIIEMVNVERYLHSARCGIVRNNGETVLAFDTRDDIERLEEKRACVIIVETNRNSVTIPLGFIVNRFEDFLQKLY